MSVQKDFKLRSINAAASRVYKEPKNSKFSSSSSSSFFSVVIIIFSILFIVSYIRSLTGAGDLTFTSFLEFIQTVPEISFANSFIDMTILGDWGIFEFLRQFINIFTNILSVLIYLFGGLVQLIMYLVYLLRYLFLI